ncbi:MAG: terminase [Hyphomicrobiales bacterium]|nr:terminase [Hyphomicrobiales bacterium]
MDAKTKQQFFKALLREDLGMFTHEAYGIIRPGDKLAWNWHIQALTWHLQEVAEGRIRRLVITVPPRSLKSICASVALPAWFLGHYPSRQVVCASYAESLAVELHNQSRRLVQSDLYRSIFPGFSLSGEKNTDTEFKTTKGGGRLATSVDGVLTGRGAEIIIIDDPLKPADAMSKAVRDRCRRWLDETVMSRLNDKSSGAIILVMQRLHVDDLAGHVLEREGWVHLNLPAIAEADERIQIGKDRWHLRRIGDLLHPEREGLAELAEMKLSLGSSGFAAQYQQQPVPTDGNMIRWSWFQRYSGVLTPGENDMIVQSWDTASKGGELNDYSACTTWMIRNNAYYLLDVYRARVDFPALRRQVIELARRYRPAAVLIEDKGSGIQLIQELRNSGDIYPIAIMPEGDKLVRASSQSAQIESGRVFLPQEAPWLGDFQLELAAFPNGRHDDQVDSMSQFLIHAYGLDLNCPRIRQL